MGAVLKENSLNKIAKGTLLFKKDEKIQYFGYIVKGSIRILNGEISKIVKSGLMVAVADLFFDQYLCDYLVEEDTVLYAFPAEDSTSLEHFLNINFDYRGIAVYSMEEELACYLKKREPFFSCAVEMFDYLKKHYELAQNDGMGEDTPQKFLNENPGDKFRLSSGEEKAVYYQECIKTPLEIHKKFYYNSNLMAFYHAGELAQMIKETLESYQALQSYLEKIYDKFWNSSGENLFDKEVRFAKKVKRSGEFQMDQFIRVTDTKDKIIGLHGKIQELMGKDLPLDEAYLEETVSSILSMSEEESKPDHNRKKSVVPEDPIPVLKDSMTQILKYAGIEKEERADIIASMNEFLNAKDKMSTDDDMRRIKRQITNYFFDIYKRCVFKWFENENVPLAVSLFLDYGLLDERLLKEEDIRFICSMYEEECEDLPCPIYTMPQWLQEIYEGRKDPSRNSFEQDYRDWLREQKRTGDITPKQEEELLEDNHKKVVFEIENMFISNNKIVNGKLSTYVPVLYSDEIYGKLDRLYLSKKKLCDAILELESKDFTIFQREVLYMNPELKIDKEYVISRVYPDSIIAPVYGTASSMWQEITGKKRDTPGRFIFPAIAETEVEKLVTKAFGRFHWEYCRCEQGISWNNIQYKSLTSEYMDYIQYYRKNPELSQEKRDKIKTQIIKARNNSREIFLIDYEMWIYSESKAAMKLNKVSRSILATYCPFNKEIRETLKMNATFAETMMRQQRMFGEKAREWELRIKRREGNNLEVPKEFYDTYNYYKNS